MLHSVPVSSDPTRARGTRAQSERVSAGRGRLDVSSTKNTIRGNHLFSALLHGSTDRQWSADLYVFSMSSPTQHARLLADIKFLQGQQRGSLAKATFGAWTAEEETEHQERGARLARLVVELETLDELTRRST